MKRLRSYLPALASGLLLVASFPTAGLWPLAWIGLVPLLVSVRGRPSAGAFARGWVTGLVFYLGALYWIAPTISNYTRLGLAPALVLLLMLSAVVALFLGLFAATVEWLAQGGAARALVAPCVWVALEWSRTFFPAAFPWAALGYSQQPALAIIQIADIGAVWLVSALLVFSNGVIAETLACGVGASRRWLVALLAAIVLDLGYGGYRLARIEVQASSAPLTVALVQGNIAQDKKWDGDWQQLTVDRYLALSRRAVEAGAEFIAWPESALPVLVNDRRTQAVAEFASGHGVWLLSGAPGYESRDGGPILAWNQAWTFDPSGGKQGPYDKIKLVPFGEYVPFGGLFGLVDKTVETVGTFGRGSKRLLFVGPRLEFGGTRGVDAVRFASLVCYEAIFPAFTRRFVADGADFLVNISNDAWYGVSSAPYQHLAMAAFRAVENRVPLLRATNTGISAVIDSSGRVGFDTDLFVQSVVVTDIRMSPSRSVYLVVGDLFAWLCVGATILLLGLRLGRRRVLRAS
ncbi:MAG: apolipoprotein N-acyltransferase [Candidatus Binatia bacterium]